MFDVLKRACRHPLDYSRISRVTGLSFKEKVQETDDAYSFIFTADRLPDWQAGQHAIFTLPGKPVEGRTWRPFSVASFKDEGVVRIGTIISDTPSSFKRHLSSLRPGEQARMFGPYGELYVRPGMRRVVGVAGGIGITPFRAIIGDLAGKKSGIELTLIYSARQDHYAYKDELEEWKERNPHIDIIYTETPEEVNAALETEMEKDDKSAHYFLSGAPGMIEALRRALRARRIPRSRIIHDPFKGY